MKTESAPVATEIIVAATAKLQKTATITLHAQDVTLQLVAERTTNGARAYALTTGADKKTLRAMTAPHPTFEVAVAYNTKLALDAAKKGWTRKVAAKGFQPKPDAFSSIPAAPKGKL